MVIVRFSVANCKRDVILSVKKNQLIPLTHTLEPKGVKLDNHVKSDENTIHSETKHEVRKQTNFIVEFAS